MKYSLLSYLLSKHTIKIYILPNNKLKMNIHKQMEGKIKLRWKESSAEPTRTISLGYSCGKTTLLFSGKTTYFVFKVLYQLHFHSVLKRPFLGSYALPNTGVLSSTPTVTVKCRTTIKTLFPYFKLCLSVKLFIYIYILSY